MIMITDKCQVCTEEKCDKEQCVDRLKSSEILESVDDLIKQIYP